MEITTTTKCCYPKQLDEFFRRFFNNQREQSASFVSNGDWTLSDFLNWICFVLPGTHLHLMLQSIDLATITTIKSLLTRKATDTPFDGIIQDVAIVLPRQDRRTKSQSIPDEVTEALDGLKSTFPRRVSLGYSRIGSSLILFSGSSFSGEGFRTFTMTGEFCQTIDSKDRLIVVDSSHKTHDVLAEQIMRYIRVAQSRRQPKKASIPSSPTEEPAPTEQEPEPTDPTAVLGGNEPATTAVLGGDDSTVLEGQSATVPEA